jgi:hypothetical protein
MVKAEEPKDEFLGEVQRRDNALQKLLNELEEDLENTDSAKNNLRASNVVAFEIGAFKRERKLNEPMSKEMIDGLIVRARTDSLEAKLNSAEMLDRFSVFEKKFRRLETFLYLGLGIGLGWLIRSII